MVKNLPLGLPRVLEIPPTSRLQQVLLVSARTNYFWKQALVALEVENAILSKAANVL